ncbi:holin family protein [Sulfitobacter guttiformis]|uniref:Holin (3TMs family) n=1 Tax=Sulfitobacter guttiformis TaxID=74349 RepID=A0A420DMV8_9RHOB|nr:holin family protein [Sulfitobacter guttiformis]KIN72927.1 putative carboxylesterase [Sulfitobacter guttiformis KCTC 32187]RKE95616.1 holin (3TMs family) [Sulfitobacter guttiformis]
MGMIENLFGTLFGGDRNLVRDTVEVFRENAEAGADRGAKAQSQAMNQYGEEFSAPVKGGFDKFMDGVNRLPRPALALGTLGLFVSAMVAPLWFAERMQGIALVPEPLWWLLGVVVSFYFGARHQVKTQEFQRSIVETVKLAPKVVENIEMISRLRSDSVGVASPGFDARLSTQALGAEDNLALREWLEGR